MSEKLFVHKYQPLTFSEFGEDNDVVKIFKTLILIDDINLLLIGDMMSGKTTLLNALIREYYAGFSPKEYEENVLYINNLKEQGIHYYRTDVKTFCQTCSTIKGKKKFIVLDDIDFINEQSQQVFRNCIDKYNHNVHFISSCCNTQKVIESLQSRLTIIKLPPMPASRLMSVLKNIQQFEHINITEDAQQFIVNISNHSIKVLINYMEKFKLLGQPITLDIANQLCSNISFLTFESYTRFVLQQDLIQAIRIIYDVYDNGYSVMDILDNYFTFIKATNMLSEDQKYIIIPFLCKYITIFHNIHEDEIELSLFTNNLVKTLSNPEKNVSRDLLSV